MKRIPGFLLFLIFILPVSAQKETKIIILHTNDLHSRLLGYSPESTYTPLTVNDDKTVGGFARIASILKSEQGDNSAVTLVMDAGDFMMGTLFPHQEIKNGFQLRLMKEMGYDVVAMGNHEYEFGPEWIGSVIHKSAEMGSIPVILSGNARFEEHDPRDNSLENDYASNLIRSNVILTKGGLKIGIFSILGKDAVNVAPASAPVTFEKQISFAREMVSELGKEGCDIVICLSHSGVTKSDDGMWKGEDVGLAQKVKGIDVIISGHTHTKLDQPIIVNGIPIVQTGEYGQFVGKLSATFKEGKLIVDDYRLIPVDDRIVGDRRINDLILRDKDEVASDIKRRTGIDYDKPVAESSFRIEGDATSDFKTSNLGPMVADAIQYYVNNSGGKGTDISLVAAGVLFDHIVPGVLTAPDVFRITPLGSGFDSIPGYALSRVYVTGKELKNIFEVLQIAYKSSPDNYCYYSGVRVQYDPERRILKKIKKIEIIKADGTSSDVDFSSKNKTLYSITADSYILKFTSIIKKMSFGLIKVDPKDKDGIVISDMKSAVIDMDDQKEGIQEGKEWLAMIKYLRSMADTNGNGIPDIDPKYATAIQSFFPVAGR